MAKHIQNTLYGVLPKHLVFCQNTYVLVLGLFIRTPKLTFLFIRKRPLMQMHCYLFLSTLDKPWQSAQSFRPCVYNQFDMEPLVGNQGIIVNPRYFYSRGGATSSTFLLNK